MAVQLSPLPATGRNCGECSHGGARPLLAPAGSWPPLDAGPGDDSAAVTGLVLVVTGLSLHSALSTRLATAGRQKYDTRILGWSLVVSSQNFSEPGNILHTRVLASCPLMVTPGFFLENVLGKNHSITIRSYPLGAARDVTKRDVESWQVYLQSLRCVLQQSASQSGVRATSLK